MGAKRIRRGCVSSSLHAELLFARKVLVFPSVKEGSPSRKKLPTKFDAGDRKFTGLCAWNIA